MKFNQKDTQKGKGTIGIIIRKLFKLSLAPMTLVRYWDVMWKDASVSTKVSTCDRRAGKGKGGSVNIHDAPAS